MDYHYIVHATTSDNVGIISAKTEQKALAELHNIYCPNGQPNENISVKIISAAEYQVNKERIAQLRKEEAEA